MADPPPVISKQPTKTASVPEPNVHLSEAFLQRQEEEKGTSGLTAEQEIRLRCVEAAALAWSGNRFSTPASHVVIGLAEDMIRKVLDD